MGTINRTLMAYELDQQEIADLHNLGHYPWDRYVERAATRLTSAGVPGNDGHSSSNSDAWAGASLPDAINMARNGWQAGVEQVSTRLDSLPPAEEVLPDWNLDVGGSICNVPAFIAGEPECMWRMSECKRDEHRLSIVVNGFISSDIDKEVGIKYATAVAAVIRNLEASGINPAVYMITPTYGASGATTDDRAAAYAVTVRDFGEPLDISRIAFAFHPSFFRRVQFAWQETNADGIQYGMGCGGYCKPTQINREMVDKMLGNVGYVAIIPSVNNLYRVSEGKMIEEMTKAVKEAIAKY